MHMLQSLFYLTFALHVSGIIITHLQEHKTTVTTVSGNRYTVIDRVKLLPLNNLERTLFNNCNFNLIYQYPLSVNLTLCITV
jgi:hypothetical protein